MAIIHSTSIVSDSCHLADDVVVGPFCVLNNCSIGAGSIVESHCVIGALPEITSFSGEPLPVFIGRGVKIRSHVTIHAGSRTATHIDDGAQIFRHAHVAHDCYVGRSALVSGGAIMCGHSILLDHATLAAGAILHQFVVVGHGAFVGAGAFVDRHVAPLSKVASRLGALVGVNEAKKDLVNLDLANEVFFRVMERYDPSNKSNERKVL